MSPVGTDGHSSCNNPVPPGTYVLDEFPFVCGLHRVPTRNTMEIPAEVELEVRWEHAHQAPRLGFAKIRFPVILETHDTPQ